MLNYEVVQDPEQEYFNQLRLEMGWGEVATGLSKVLLGYATMFLGITVGLGLVLVALYGLPDEPNVKKAAAAGAKPNLGSLWALYFGLGILSIVGFVSYWMIVGGQFRCMMGAAERNGARWFMFCCIACLFLGPAFELATGIANWQALSDLKQNPQHLQHFQLNPLGRWLHVIAFGIGMLYPLCFLLFLRASAVCLRADTLVMLINSFGVFAVALVAATGFAIFQHPPGGRPMPPGQAMLLGMGWLAMVVMYIGLIVMTRVSISAVMNSVKSPLDA